MENKTNESYDLVEKDPEMYRRITEEALAKAQLEQDNSEQNQGPNIKKIVFAGVLFVAFMVVKLVWLDKR